MGAHRRKNRGFTLIETLIVVGVVAVLVAVSLPLFMDAIEKANISADEAYERAALAKANALYANAELDSVHMYEYDPETGNFYISDSPEAIAIPVYGKCSHHKGGYLWVGVGTGGAIGITWAAPKGSVFWDDYDNTTPHHEDRNWIYM